MPPQQTLVTKAEFARRRGVTPAAVSMWISRGRISSGALINDGKGERIWLEQATKDLELALDATQPDASLWPNGAAAPANGSGANDVLPAASVDHELLRRLRRAQAERAEHEAEAARRRNMVETGRWMEVEEARQNWTREVGAFIGRWENFLMSAGPRAIDDAGLLRPGADQKSVAIALRRAWHGERDEIAEDAGRKRRAIEAEDHLARKRDNG
jgi:hypothetical protein